MAQISKLAWSPLFQPTKIAAIDAKKTPILADFDPIFPMSLANPPLSPSRGHVPKNAVLSAFFEGLQLRAAHPKITKKTFSAFFDGMAWSFCPFFASKKDNLACTSTIYSSDFRPRHFIRVHSAHIFAPAQP
ncbi:MAG TPA: hypothetical protein VFI95_00385, partial [Terriglobales bacterium]|nr:hypothetical protein [Terriglobales bacterium]